MREALPTRQRLLLALAKLRRDAGPNAKTGPSISAVAREAGVSHTLIHTKHSDIADKIRDGNGKGPKQRLAKQQELLEQAQESIRKLRDELTTEKKLNRGLASENGRLTLLVFRLENEVAALDSGARVLRPKPQSHKTTQDSG
ncbi:hypothetical protein [Paraburkholderia sp. BL10I2N1]|uniref:hypothetical protein n=1 Tax=Paraburkholderia sp. BL10I2N1 TaxID=1938796 RepID=UPI0010613FA7|nr:hypothetical protein [Paraburkholderia sp. BL10I2N1]TDN68781.1 hypothetical protein B0G77_2126 [Paraburkholderia sp. BL10I2N1]